MTGGRRDEISLRRLFAAIGIVIRGDQGGVTLKYSIYLWAKLEFDIAFIDVRASLYDDAQFLESGQAAL